MTTLLKIKGLDRGSSAVGADIHPRGFRVKSALLQRRGGTGTAAAVLTIGTVNAQVKYTSKFQGTSSHGITVAHVDNAGNNNPLTVTVTYGVDGWPDIVVQLATDGGGTPNSTALQVVTAVNASAEAAQFVTASVGTGTGASAAVTGAAAPLASGNNGTGSADAAVYLTASNKVTVVVDVDDQETVKALRKNHYRFVSLGVPS